jgi:hypothetical protein
VGGGRFGEKLGLQASLTGLHLVALVEVEKPQPAICGRPNPEAESARPRTRHGWKGVFGRKGGIDVEKASYLLN